MEVKRADETSMSVAGTLGYAAIAGLLAFVLLLPVLVLPSYDNVLNTLLLLGLSSLAVRELVSGLLAFSRVDPPPIDEGTELPSVSVVIPAYNEESVLPGTIAACADVDYPEEKLEVILCYEAASTDRTAEIAERAAAADERFVAVRRDESGGGKAKATNYALRFATGDVVASIDADHRFKPDAVRRAVAWFLADEETWCVKGRCFGENPSDSAIALFATVERHIAEKADLFAREVVDGFTIFGGGQAFFRAEVFEVLGEFDDEVLVEDIDMSSRIHGAGKDLHVDPRIVTYEENPATFVSWWAQRKRWARGWMQVAVRYLPGIHREIAFSRRKKADAAFTFAFALVPAMLFLAFPLSGLDRLSGFDAGALVPNAWLFWTALTATPTAVAYLVFLQDWRDGETHHPLEYLAAFVIVPYLVFQTAVYLVAFLDEFVLDRPAVYVTTARSGHSSG